MRILSSNKRQNKISTNYWRRKNSAFASELSAVRPAQTEGAHQAASLLGQTRFTCALDMRRCFVVLIWRSRPFCKQCWSWQSKLHVDKHFACQWGKRLSTQLACYGSLAKTERFKLAQSNQLKATQCMVEWLTQPRMKHFKCDASASITDGLVLCLE